ncbi:hypothetical protein, partial [Bacillus salipaludis]
LNKRSRKRRITHVFLEFHSYLPIGKCLYSWRIFTRKDIFGRREKKELLPTNQFLTKIGG